MHTSSFARTVLHLAVLAALLVLVVPDALAQDDSERDGPDRKIRGMMNVNFDVGFPVGAFGDNVDGAAFGGSFMGGVYLGRSPVLLGIDAGFLVYGWDSREVPFSTTVPVRVDLTTTNNIFQPHVVLRMQPSRGTFRPYVEGLGGFKYLYTETKVQDVDGRDDRDIASETNFDDFAWSLGAGGGFDLSLYRPSRKRGDYQKRNPLHSINLHVGLRYLLGGEAEYGVEGEVFDDNNNGTIDPSELDVRFSNTHLIIPRIGVTFLF